MFFAPTAVASHAAYNATPDSSFLSRFVKSPAAHVHRPQHRGDEFMALTNNTADGAFHVVRRRDDATDWRPFITLPYEWTNRAAACA